MRIRINIDEMIVAQAEDRPHHRLAPAGRSTRGSAETAGAIGCGRCRGAKAIPEEATGEADTFPAAMLRLTGNGLVETHAVGEGSHPD